MHWKISSAKWRPFCLGGDELTLLLLELDYTTATETEMSSFWRNFHHWLHRKLSKWQLSVQSMIKISSKWQHFRFSELRRTAGGSAHWVVWLWLSFKKIHFKTLSAKWQPFCFGLYMLTTHWGRDKMDAIFQMTFSNAFYWMKMFKFWLRFHWSLFPRVQLTIFQHWFR